MLKIEKRILKNCTRDTKRNDMMETYVEYNVKNKLTHNLHPHHDKPNTSMIATMKTLKVEKIIETVKEINGLECRKLIVLL